MATERVGYVLYRALVRSGMRVTDLPPIQSSIQPEKIEKWTSELKYHEESTQDEELIAIT